MTFGQRLRELRLDRGWTKTELARRANISASGISLLERDLRRPYDLTIHLLALALRVPREDLEQYLRPKDAKQPAPEEASA